MIRQNKILYLLILIAVIASLFVAFKRLSLERSNRTVEIALDYTAVRDLCLKEGYELNVFLQEAKKFGVTSLAVPEADLEILASNGKLTYFSGTEILNRLRFSQDKLSSIPCEKISPAYVYVFVDDAVLRKKIYDSFVVFLGKGRVAEISQVIQVKGKVEDLSRFSLGFLVLGTDEWEKMGFSIVARVENKTEVNKEKINYIFNSLKENKKVTNIIFSGLKNEVLGYLGELTTTAEFLEKMNISFGYVEVPEARRIQKGTMTLARLLPEKVVRAQTILPQQLQKATPQKAISTFILGVNERNIRLLYVRPFASSEEDKNLIDTNKEYLSSLCKDLTRQGFSFGRAGTFKKFNVPFPLVLLISLGSGALIVLLLSALFPSYNAKYNYPILGLIILGSIGSLVTGKVELWSKILALGGAVCTPSLAMIDYINRDEKKNLLVLCADFFRVIGISLVGGLFIVGLLSSTSFMLQINRFLGVKVLMIVPVLIVLYYIVTDNGKKGIKETWKSLVSQPVCFGHVLALLVVLVASYIYISRTGNVSGVPALESEREARDLLTSIFTIRPRFKEFLLGFPALVMATGLVILGATKYRWLFIALAAMAVADMVDTFAHIHTPLLISLGRVFLSMGLGFVIGMVIFLIFKKFYLKKT